MAFMSEFELPQEVRDRLETLWRRVTAPQTKNLLWERHLSRHAGLGASLEECLAKRDLVGAWILTRRPHPRRPWRSYRWPKKPDSLTPRRQASCGPACPPRSCSPIPCRRNTPCDRRAA